MLCRWSIKLWKPGGGSGLEVILGGELNEGSDATKMRQDLWLATSAQRALMMAGLVSAMPRPAATCYRQLGVVERGKGGREREGGRERTAVVDRPLSAVFPPSGLRVCGELVGCGLARLPRSRTGSSPRTCRCRLILPSCANCNGLD